MCRRGIPREPQALAPLRAPLKGEARARPAGYARWRAPQRPLAPFSGRNFAIRWFTEIAGRPRADAGLRHLFLRVSTDKQGASGLGLEAQREAVARHVAVAAGVIVGEFQEIEAAGPITMVIGTPR